MNFEYLWIMLHSDDDEGREMLFQVRNIIGITEKLRAKGNDKIRVTNIMGVDGGWYRVKESAKEIKDMLSKAYGGR